MAIYGRTIYGGPPANPLGDSFYGWDYPPQYLVDPFLAQSSNYSTIQLSWQQPQGTVLAFRLVRNRFGFPTTPDDGDILMDVASGYPGNKFADTNVIPGKFHYYSIWLLLDFTGDVWVLAGIAACLAVNSYSSNTWLFNHTPVHFRDIPSTELTTDTLGNPYILQFYSVLGWGIDYLKTQYDTYQHVNDPWQVPVADLNNLATELGMDVVPGIPGYTLRKAIYNNATINKQRGTPQGIAEEITALTGWDIDLQIGVNQMLENDQSYFPDPGYPAWSANLSYKTGERVSFGNFIYVSNTTGNLNNQPTGANSNNTNWNVLYYVDDSTHTLLNSVTGWYNTWEPLYPSVSNGIAGAGAMTEGLGIENPLNTALFNSNDLRVYNVGGSAQNVWARSASRSTAVISSPPANFAVDNTQIIHDGIPVPFLRPWQAWNAATEYGTGDIVGYGGRGFIALRASTGATPPVNDTPTNEWAALGYDNRLRLMLSGYFSQNLSTGTTETYAVTPFVEWYDQWGNYINRIFARTPTAGTPGLPDQLAFDSFTNLGTANISAHTMDAGVATWTVQAGGWTVSDFSGGTVYPTTAGTRSELTTTTSQANCQISVTIVTAPEITEDMGIVFRRSDDNNYFRAGLTQLKEKNAGTFSTLGTYSTAFSAGDRMTVQLNGTSITILRNNVSVLTTTSSFNQTATVHGIIAE